MTLLEPGRYVRCRWRACGVRSGLTCRKWVIRDHRRPTSVLLFLGHARDWASSYVSMTGHHVRKTCSVSTCHGPYTCVARASHVAHWLLLFFFFFFGFLPLFSLSCVVGTVVLRLPSCAAFLLCRVSSVPRKGLKVVLFLSSPRPSFPSLSFPIRLVSSRLVYSFPPASIHNTAQRAHLQATASFSFCLFLGTRTRTCTCTCTCTRSRTRIRVFNIHN